MKKDNINFVQFNVSRFINDPDFILMNLEERGLYLTMIFMLFMNDGSMKLEPGLFRFFNCRSEKQFLKIWDKVKFKFEIKRKKLTNPFVTSEYRRIEKYRQSRAAAGLKGAAVTWQSHGSGNGTAAAKEREGKVSESKVSNDKESDETKRKGKVSEITERNEKDATLSDSSFQSLSSSPSLRAEGNQNNPADSEPEIQKKAMLFQQELRKLIVPHSKSDLTCNRKILNWLVTGCRDRKFTVEMFDHVLKLAREAKTGDNPQALFMSLLKQLGYHPKKEYE